MHSLTSEQRYKLRLLQQLEAWLRLPMALLSLAWLLLLVLELVRGTTRLLEVFGLAIWIIFIAEFAIRLWLAPEKIRFLRRNWLTVIALVVPALRLLTVFRMVRVVRAARGLRLIRIVGSTNRGMTALRRSMRRRGLGYVLGLTFIVMILGAAGMIAFEPASEISGGFRGYGDALWWTAMLLTTMGTDFWPQTVEGRVLSFLLALYGFAVFGYITASFAAFFVDREAASARSEVAGAKDVRALQREISLLRLQLENNPRQSGDRTGSSG